MRNKLHNFIPANYLFSVPAAYLSLGLLGGILTANYFSPIVHIKSNFVICIIIMFLLVLINKKSKEFSVLAAFIAGFFFQNAWQTNQNFGENMFNDGEKIQIYAEFYNPPNYRSEKEMTQQATISNTDFRINIILSDSLTNSVIIPGERAKIAGIFRKFDTQNTAAPWEYDNIFQDRINNTIGDIEVLSIEKSVINPVAANLHNYIRKKFENTRYNSLYVSLFTGDRSFVTPDIKSFFQESGLIHFLSVSGMHIAILIVAFSMIVSIFPLPILARNIIIAGLILCLPLIVGFNPATLRAVIMGIIVVLSSLFNRKSNALNSLFVACFIILSVYPMHFFLVGFQYSFAATFGILILPKILKNIKYKKTVLIFILPIFLFLLTTPIQIYHFATITPSSPFCNLFVLPIFEFICNLALISLFIPIDGISQFLLKICDKILDFAFWVINKFIIFTDFGEQYTSISQLWFLAIIIVIFVCASFQKHKIIYSFYAILFLVTTILIFELLKKEIIYTVSSQNFRMKLLSGRHSKAVILGDAQTKLYYNPKFRRWLKTNLDGGLFVNNEKPIIITDESYIPSEILENYTHIILKNTTGEIKFDCENNEYKTEKIAPEEKKQRKIGVNKVFYKNIVK